MYSNISVPADQFRLKELFHGAVKAPASSSVTSYLRVLKSGRETRSIRCRRSVCGMPSRFIHARSFIPTVSMRSVSLFSQRPMECP